MAYPLREHDPERVREEMLIGSKKRFNGVYKYWAGPDLGYQSKETFEKLKKEGYDGDQDYMLLGGWQARRAQLGINKVMKAAAPVVTPVLTPRVATPAPRPILSSKKWSQDLTDLKIKISRSDGRITYASLYGYAEWDLTCREWFAWVEWIEDGSNPRYYRGQSLNKRLPLNSLLTINHDNVMFQYLGRKLIKKRISI